jgi:hypothetical protein
MEIDDLQESHLNARNNLLLHALIITTNPDYSVSVPFLARTSTTNGNKHGS